MTSYLNDVNCDGRRIAAGGRGKGTVAAVGGAVVSIGLTCKVLLFKLHVHITSTISKRAWPSHTLHVWVTVSAWQRCVQSACLAHTVSVTSLHSCFTYSDASHIRQAWHLRSDVIVGLRDTKESSPHVVSAAHVRSVVGVGAATSYCSDGTHDVTARHTRSVLAVGGRSSNWLLLHDVIGAHVRSVRGVHVRVSY